jgi:hypothetical protein
LTQLFMFNQIPVDLDVSAYSDISRMYVPTRDIFRNPNNQNGIRSSETANDNKTFWAGASSRLVDVNVSPSQTTDSETDHSVPDLTEAELVAAVVKDVESLPEVDLSTVLDSKTITKHAALQRWGRNLTKHHFS